MSSENPISITRFWARLKLEHTSAEYAKPASAIIAWIVLIGNSSQVSVCLSVWIVHQSHWHHLNEVLRRRDWDEADGADKSESNEEHQIARQRETRWVAPFVDGLVLGEERY